MKNEKQTEYQYKGGVLVIGSLFWEKTEIRDKWRKENLNFDEKKIVDLPIRYGRISESRKFTYSMVFSTDSKFKEKIGKGYFIPFKKALAPIEIIEQGKKIINAEHNKVVEFRRFNWGWGCLGLSINPKLMLEESKSIKKVDSLLELWKSKFGNRFEPNHYKTNTEEPIMTSEGILKINWQDDVLLDYDFAIGTATKPELKAYPDSKKIATKMVINEYDEYFVNNRKSSIMTFQDIEIETELNKLSG